MTGLTPQSEDALAQKYGFGAHADSESAKRLRLGYDGDDAGASSSSGPEPTFLDEYHAAQASSEDSRKLHVGSLPPDMTEQPLVEYFASAFGPVESCRVIRDWETGISRGFCLLRAVS